MALLTELGLVSLGYYKYVSPDGLSMHRVLSCFADAWRQIDKLRLIYLSADGLNSAWNS